MFDLFAAVITVLLLASYHLFLRLALKRDPFFTVHALNKLAREMWVETLMGQRGPDILAVQTLRNSVMASSFMASTAILLLIAAFSAIGSGDHGSSILHSLNMFGAINEGMLATKVICLLTDFFVAFFCFAMSVRFYNHVGYLVSVPRERGTISPGLVTAYLNRGGLFYFIGIRSFFYAVPLVFWLFGPEFMMGAAVVLISAMYPLDRAPRAEIGRADRGAVTAANAQATIVTSTSASDAKAQRSTEQRGGS